MEILRMVAGIVRGGPCGMWGAVQAYIERRAARVFERERRMTLMLMPQALPPGTLLFDRRADGSVLELRIPALAHRSIVARETVVDVTVPGLRADYLRPGNAGPRQIAAGPQADCQE